MKKGNVLLVAMIFVSIGIVIFLLIAVIIRSQINSLLYGIKLEMDMLNRSAILSVNKMQTSMSNFSYQEEAYRESFQKALQNNFHLSETLEEGSGMIESIQIKEYAILEKGERDSYSEQRTQQRIIHTVIHVKVKPMILREILEKVLSFDIHEDVKIELAYEEE